MIPLMVGILKLGQHRAHGTSLVALVFTGISGAVTYTLNGSVDFMAAVFLAATAVITARFGAHSAHALAEWKLKRSFGAFLILVSLLLLLKFSPSDSSGPVKGGEKAAILLMTGAFTGFLSGMMGVGGGTIMVPVMVLLAGFGQHTAQGSSLLAMVPAGAAGAYTHWRLGNVAVSLLSGLVPGILLGTYLGGSLAHVLPDGTLRLIFAAVLLSNGLGYLRTKRPGEKVPGVHT